jgi:NAD(P)-dependent dehydrogenase (short-subunit alcohol dehydrogenase family)
MKINIITGGSRGLGRSMALHLVDQGQDSIITYDANKATADEVVKAIKAKGHKAVALWLDVSKIRNLRSLRSRCENGFGRHLKARHLCSPGQQCRHRRWRLQR